MSTVEKRIQRDLDDVAAIEAVLKAERGGGSTEVTPEEALAAAALAEETERANTEAVPPVAQPATTEIRDATVEKGGSEVEDAEYWRQRFNTVQGLLSAQSRQTKDASAQVQALSAELADLRKIVESKPAPAPAPSGISDKDKETFGEDLIDLQRRVAHELVAPIQAKLDAVEQENKVLRETLGQTDAQVASMNFDQQLAIAFPDFQEINSDPRWVAWLNEVDPMSNTPRRDVAQAAFANGDAQGVARFVSLWKQSVAPAVVEQPSKSELESQVAPNRGASTVPAGEAVGKTYTAAEADAAWAKVSDLNRRGKYEEASTLEAELTEAYTSGRVR